MAKRKSKAEIAAILRSIERQRAKGIPVSDCCKAQGISDQNYYRWRSEASSDAEDPTRQLRELASEVERLKQVLAEVMLDNQMLRSVAKKKW